LLSRIILKIIFFISFAIGDVDPLMLEPSHNGQLISSAKE
jgi:hypothetical protein